ncbi:hypothetical protein ACVMYR_18830 [Micromonospora sp. PTRAS2]
MWVAVLLAALFIAVFLASAFAKIESSERTSVSAESVAASDPESVPGLSGKGWKVDYQVDGIDFAGRHVGDRMPGELVVEWQSSGGLAFRQEIWVEKAPLSAYWHYRTANPRPRFGNGAERDLVVDVSPSVSLHADSREFFCGNRGNSRADVLEDCQVWGYWARYGQYLLYLELGGDPQPKSVMESAVADFDERLNRL